MDIDQLSARKRACNERNILQMIANIRKPPALLIKFLDITYDYDWPRTRGIIMEAANRTNSVVFFDDWSEVEPASQPVRVYFVSEIHELCSEDFWPIFVADALPPTRDNLTIYAQLPEPGTANVIINWVDENLRFDAEAWADAHRSVFGKRYKVSSRMLSEKSIRWYGLVLGDNIPEPSSE
jgi:hypothetical protein